VANHSAAINAMGSLSIGGPLSNSNANLTLTTQTRTDTTGGRYIIPEGPVVEQLMGTLTHSC
jgi:hypothetical protein